MCEIWFVGPTNLITFLLFEILCQMYGMNTLHLKNDSVCLINYVCIEFSL